MNTSIVGREREVLQAREAFGRLVQGIGGENVLFVTGEAGIGKSTLLAAIREDCEARYPAASIAAVECSTPLAGTDIGGVEALEPWAQLIARLADPKRSGGTETRRLAGELAMAWMRVIPVVGDVLESVIDTAKIVGHHVKGTRDEPQHAASQQQMFQQYINLLARLAERSPVILMIDDAHWADASSCNLLFAAARQLHGKPVAFVVAYRPDDLAGHSGQEHPLLQVRAELERYSMAVEIGVPRMTPGDLDTLLRSRYPEYQNDDAFESWIAQVSNGNALFITQFLETLEADGAVHRRTGQAREGYRSVPVPASAQAVVNERIRRLDDETRELLRYASVEGDTFTATVLSRIAELPQLKLLQRLRLLEEAHRVIRSLGKQRVYAGESTTWQFSHVLVHRAMYDSLMEEERELLHGAVLDILREEWDRARGEGTNVEGTAARIAVHANILGEHLFAAEVLLEGARSAWREFASTETSKLLDQVDAAIQSAFGKDEELLSRTSRKEIAAARGATIRGDAEFLRGSIRKTHSEYLGALERFNAARRWFDVSFEVRRSIDAIARCAEVLELLERRDEAREHALRANGRAHDIDYREAETDTLVTLGRLASSDNDLAAAADSFKRALEIAESINDDVRAVLALDSMGNMQERMLDSAGARESYRKALTIAERSGDLRSEMLVRNSLGCLFLAEANEDALGELERGLVLARVMGDREAEARFQSNLGIVAWMQDRHDESLDNLAHALELYRAIESRFGEAMVLSNIADGLHDLGRDEESLPLFRQALAIMQELGYQRHLASFHNNLGVTLRKLGRFSEAIDEHRSGIAAAIEAKSPDNEALNRGNFALALAALAEQTGSGPNPERSANLASARESMQACLALLGVDNASYEYWKERSREIPEGEGEGEKENCEL